MNIAGVSVNEKNLPTKEKVIEEALKSKNYYQLPQKKALILINKEIKESGLFKTDTGKVKKQKSKSSVNSSKRSYYKQP